MNEINEIESQGDEEQRLPVPDKHRPSDAQLRALGTRRRIEDIREAARLEREALGEVWESLMPGYRLG